MQDDKTTAVTEEKVKPKRPVRAYEDELKKDNEDYLKGLQDEMKKETETKCGYGRVRTAFVKIPVIGQFGHTDEYLEDTKKQKQAVDELKASLGTSTSLNAKEETYKENAKVWLKDGKVPQKDISTEKKDQLSADLICEHGGSKKEREALNNFSKNNTPEAVKGATDILNAMDESPYKSMKKDMIMGDKVLKQASQCPHAAASIKHMGENLGSMNRSSAVFIQVLETATKAQDVDAAKARIDFLKENFTSIGGAVDRAALKSFADKFDKEPNFKIDIHDKGQRADFAASIVGKYPKIYDAMKEAYAGKDGEGKMSNRELAIAVSKMAGKDPNMLATIEKGPNMLATIEKGLENPEANKAFREGLKSSMTKEAGVRVADVGTAVGELYKVETKRMNEEKRALDQKQKTDATPAVPTAATEIYSSSKELLDAQRRNSMSLQNQYTNLPHDPNQPAGAGVNAPKSPEVVPDYGFIPSDLGSQSNAPIPAAATETPPAKPLAKSDEYASIAFVDDKAVVLPPPPPPMQVDSPGIRDSVALMSKVVTGNPPAYDPGQGKMNEASHQNAPSPDAAKAAGHGANIGAARGGTKL